MYEFIAHSYNGLYGEEQLEKLNKIKEILNLLNIKNALLLDVGAGTGLDFNVFKDISNYVGIDNCYEMVCQAVEQNPNTCFFLADAEDLPFKDNLFDVVVCVSAIHNFISPAKALQEMIRVSKHKSIIIITILKRSKQFKKLLDLCKSILNPKIFKHTIMESSKDIIFIADSYSQYL